MHNHQGSYPVQYLSSTDKYFDHIAVPHQDAWLRFQCLSLEREGEGEDLAWQGTPIPRKLGVVVMQQPFCGEDLLIRQ